MNAWDHHACHRYSPQLTANIRHADVVRMLDQLQAIRPEAMTVEQLGLSAEGRSISLITMGTGSRRVLAWSQMHGNEPTHTAVLLDLMHYLQKYPKDAIASEILEGCTLHLIPMLNPDGAQRYSRRNAQSLDINRDALHVESSEASILRAAVENLRPDIALNLHNQDVHTSVGCQPTRVAAVSLLVPPLDFADTQTAETECARRLASCVLHAVEPHGSGMVSRYDADFMPRCFGEWVQQQGVATLTIEAGGWTTPHTDESPLVRIHYAGIVGLLESVANDSYLQAAPTAYDSLPRSNGRNLHDIVVRHTKLLESSTRKILTADLAISFPDIQSRAELNRQGSISDLGDLCVETGKVELPGENLLCLAGRFAYLADVAPGQLPDREMLSQLLGQGITSVLGKVDLADSAQVAALAEMSETLALPVNLGFVADLCHLGELDHGQGIALLTRAIARGIVGIVGDDVPFHLEKVLEQFQISRIAHQRLAFAANRTTTYAETTSEAATTADLLGQPLRGRVRLESVADLALVRFAEPLSLESQIRWDALQQVMLAGNVVFDKGEIVAECGGRLLGNRIAPRTD